MQDLRKLIEDAWEDRSLLQNNDYATAVETIIERLNNGEIFPAQKHGRNKGWPFCFP